MKHNATIDGVHIAIPKAVTVGGNSIHGTAATSHRKNAYRLRVRAKGVNGKRRVTTKAPGRRVDRPVGV